MREYTNLQWPETPFGAEQRPFGRQWDMLTACTLEWTTETDGGMLPVASSFVYLRVRKHGTAQAVSEDTLSIGFRAIVIDDPAHVRDLLTVTERELSGARRLGVILAGHALSRDLTRMTALSATPLRGAIEVEAAWTRRDVKQRGAAVMVDTAVEAAETGVRLDMPIDPVPEGMPDCPACAADVARRALTRCLAVGLTAAVHTQRYTWEETFRVGALIERAGWDVLNTGADTAACPSHDTGVPLRDPVALAPPTAGGRR
ncbi:hypothetical protein ACFQS1_39945 [Paractinoplanes rhizophilus]|uniref:EAL domain-containing protein n=1 Tax=Paractinoplanes rhizophilus TaxID=1416877 RepID=A0ABW2I5P0_9ACTN